MARFIAIPLAIILTIMFAIAGLTNPAWFAFIFFIWMYPYL